VLEVCGLGCSAIGSLLYQQDTHTLKCVLTFLTPAPITAMDFCIQLMPCMVKSGLGLASSLRLLVPCLYWAYYYAGESQSANNVAGVQKLLDSDVPTLLLQSAQQKPEPPATVWHALSLLATWPRDGHAVAPATFMARRNGATDRPACSVMTGAVAKRLDALHTAFCTPAIMHSLALTLATTLKRACVLQLGHTASDSASIDHKTLFAACLHLTSAASELVVNTSNRSAAAKLLAREAAADGNAVLCALFHGMLFPASASQKAELGGGISLMVCDRVRTMLSSPNFTSTWPEFTTDGRGIINRLVDCMQRDGGRAIHVASERGMQAALMLIHRALTCVAATHDGDPVATAHVPMLECLLAVGKRWVPQSATVTRLVCRLLTTILVSRNLLDTKALHSDNGNCLSSSQLLANLADMDFFGVALDSLSPFHRDDSFVIDTALSLLLELLNSPWFVNSFMLTLLTAFPAKALASVTTNDLPFSGGYYALFFAFDARAKCLNTFADVLVHLFRKATTARRQAATNGASASALKRSFQDAEPVMVQAGHGSLDHYVVQITKLCQAICSIYGEKPYTLIEHYKAQLTHRRKQLGVREGQGHDSFSILLDLFVGATSDLVTILTAHSGLPMLLDLLSRSVFGVVRHQSENSIVQDGSTVTFYAVMAILCERKAARFNLMAAPGQVLRLLLRMQLIANFSMCCLRGSENQQLDPQSVYTTIDTYVEDMVVMSKLLYRLSTNERQNAIALVKAGAVPVVALAIGMCDAYSSCFHSAQYSSFIGPGSTTWARVLILRLRPQLETVYQALCRVRVVSLESMLPENRSLAFLHSH
jgi:hypothetical protein